MRDVIFRARFEPIASHAVGFDKYIIVEVEPPTSDKKLCTHWITAVEIAAELADETTAFVLKELVFIGADSIGCRIYKRNEDD